MTKNEFNQFFDECLETMRAIRRAKNSDYTGVTDDPFANFRMAESLGITTTEKALLVRMMDKMARLKSFTEKGSHEVKDESVKDSCIDLANYAIIFAGLWSQKVGIRRAEAKPGTVWVSSSPRDTVNAIIHVPGQK